MTKLNNVKIKPHPVRKLLKRHNVFLWQVIRRFASNGVHFTEPRLSRVLRGIEIPSPEVARELEKLRKGLQELET